MSNNDSTKHALTRTTNNAWNLFVGRELCANVQQGLDHEWLVTNGLGGYASGSIVGATTRCYHGLLVAALRPPVERTVLVTKVDEEITLPNGQLLKLGVNEYQDGTIDPQGYQYLDSFALEADIPCFEYRLDDNFTLVKRIWMEYAQNTTYVQYTLRGTPHDTTDDTPLTLTLYPFCLERDYHSITKGTADWHFLVENQGNRCRIRAYEGAPAYQLIAGPSAQFSPTGYWYWHVLHRRDRERGLPDVEDVYQPGTFRLQITPGERITLVLSSEQELAPEFGGSQHEDAVAQAFTRHQRRIKQLLAIADRSTDNLPKKDPVHARLVLAADQFIVVRPETYDGTGGSTQLQLSPNRKTIIAGYPWFTDWGRDTMISLPGLLLYTGRYSEARGLLKAFASFTHEGLIPNRFPDSRGDALCSPAPEYNTADATLWMFHAIDSYLNTTGDWSLLKELFPTLSDIIAWHVHGTAYGIGVDPNDGLLHAGAPGVQLTWMDAKVDDRVITPRHGKPVEVNALWYYTLNCMESWAVRLAIDATQYGELRSKVSQHFVPRFWYEAGGYLYDVVDVEGVAGKNDPSLRPNQLFAASFTRCLLTEEQRRSMLQKVTDALLTPMGLRTLSPDDPAYCKHFNGNREQRDSAYHQGAVWPWLIGPYVDVHLRLHNDPNAIRPLLQPLVHHLWDACLGTISEVAEPEPPFTPAGCFAQAWSVAEVLRCWLLAAG
jgi:predicted glycogen debranching enzyme